MHKLWTEPKSKQINIIGKSAKSKDISNFKQNTIIRKKNQQKNKTNQQKKIDDWKKQENDNIRKGTKLTKNHQCI